MPRRAKGITAALVAKGKVGRYCDGDGLWLLIRSSEAKFWSFKYTQAGRTLEMGLGPASGRKSVTLTAARAKARELWDAHIDGRDPLAERRARGRSLARPDATKGSKGVRTFKMAAIEYIEAHRASWKNPVSFKQWMQSLQDYVFPLIGDMAVDAIGTDHVAAVLTPIWNTKSETASRLRGRIEVILNREKALKNRSGENPAVWKANLEAVFPETKEVASVRNHPAMPSAEIGNFMTKLRAKLFVVGDDGRRTPDIINHALEFCILRCARTANVLKANWGEINWDQRLWTIPPEKMKGKRNREREHRVALSSRAIEILKEMEAIKVSSFVFPGRREGKSLSATVLEARLRQMEPVATVHGFRSTFRDWVGDETDFPGELAEVALAHKVGNAVEQAYRRGDGLKKRYVLAEAWSKFCDQQPINDGSNVVNFRGSAK